MSRGQVIKVLLIEDDEDDYILTKELFSEIRDKRFKLEWVTNFDRGLETISRNEHDICLVDYRLGAHTGIDLLREAAKRNCKAPIILLTGQGEHEVDLEAMRAGAADYLVKGRLDAALLERSIRYALERCRAAATAAAEQARLAAFGAEVGLALTRRDSLECILQRCAKGMLKYLNGALARIWVFEADENAFKLMASEGLSENGGPKKPKVDLDPETLQQGSPVLIKQVIGDSRFLEQEWAERQGIVSCAAFPLLLEDRLVGLLGLFTRNAVTDSILEELGSVAHGIALCVERKRSEEALGVSEFKYRSVVENIKEVIFQVDEKGRFLFVNPAWTSITGYKVKDTTGTPLANYIHPEDRERHWDVFQQLIERKQSHFRDEARYLASDGTFRWVEVYAQPILDSDAFGASGTIRDITDRRRAEAEIQKLAAFVRYNPNPVMELAADGTLTYLNPAAHEMAQTLNLEDPSAILPKDAAAIAQECLRSGHSKFSQELAIDNRTLSWSFFPIIPSQVVHCYGTDITDRTTLEEQLRHAQKLESIGQLAAGVAHDFNNILTIIQGHADLLVANAATPPKTAEPLKQISAAARRGSTLTRQLLAFSRRQVIQTKILDLNTVLANMSQMVTRLLGEDITLEADYAPGLPSIEADSGMIEQVLLNLAVNSRDAMPNGGKLTVTTRTLDIDQAYVDQHPDARLGKFVCVSVTDTGCGMSPETLARVFEPFFTTKEVGKGTGLGLATVYGIVKQHQGWVEVSSRLGIGTTFKFYLPPSMQSAEPTPETADAARTPGGCETILLVEDEPVLRELARMILQDYDYVVLEAGNGVEALKVWDEHNGRIDLLLTDMVMPEGMNGRELAEKLKVRNPNLKVIYTSGYSFDAIGNEASLGEARFLQKPYPPPQLAQTVRECLDTKP